MATGNAQPSQIQGVLIGVTALAILIVTPFLVIRFRRRTLGGVKKDTSALLTPGKVRFVFHKYSGFLIWVREYSYDTVLPLDDAEALLKKLVRHNMTWGLLVYGGPFVPLFTFFEWRAQKRRIAAARPGFPISATQKK